MFLESRAGPAVRYTTRPPSVNRPSTQFGILDISQPFRPPRPVRRIALLIKKTKLHGLSPRANYTDRATVACRRSDCQLVRIEGAT
jgi:hypothetical protein